MLTIELKLPSCSIIDRTSNKLLTSSFIVGMFQGQWSSVCVCVVGGGTVNPNYRVIEIMAIFLDEERLCKLQ